MAARCHGPLSFAGTQFVAPMDGEGGDFSVADIRANYDAARRNLALGGDGSRSRLLVKALPLDAGGVLHRGGNDLFFPHVGGADPRDSDGARAIVAWADAERAAIVGGEAPATPSGILFVRGPVSARPILALDGFRPGSDVWFYPSLTPGATAIPLTAGAHVGLADVRDPAVSHDGTRVLFAMRRSKADCMNIYEIGLDGTGLRQLTHDSGLLPGGGKAVNRWPIYAPGGRIVFVSTRAGELDETSRALDAELWMIPEAGGAPVRLTYTPTPELAPTMLATGEFRGSLAFTTIRRGTGGFKGAVFRFAIDHDRAHHLQPEYHPHHGQTAPADVTWAMRELPDGRDVAVLMDRDSMWESGQLAIFERQLGPDLAADAMADVSVPGFRHAVSVLDSRGAFRDPAPLPDGRIVVSWSATDGGDSGLYLLTLGAGKDGEPTLADRTPLLDAPGLADDQPAIVFARPDEDDAHADAWDPMLSTGVLRHSGLAVNGAILGGGLGPSGPKPFPPGGAGARLVGWWPTSPASLPVMHIDPALIANHDPASTWWSNGVHGPVRVLAELPLAPDGTLFAAPPARAGFRVQLLDEDGLVAGAQSQLWLHFLGGEVVPQGVPVDQYPRLCSGCHGALDGRPADALPPMIDLDAIAGASITQATNAAANPRRPLAPAVVADPRVSFDFGRDLAPIFVRSCALAGCHAGAAPAGGLDLDAQPTDYYDSAYEALQAFGDGSGGGKKWIDERDGSARRSFLMEKLLDRELDAPRALDAPCPPPGSSAPPLTREELAAIARWIDLGAIYRTPPEQSP
jgi:hypothetical protein